MQELISSIEKWFEQGKQVALATVIRIHGSVPRELGATMAISQACEMAGSVSAGCVEGAVVQEALQVLKTGKAVEIHYGISDEMAFTVGLACGGNLDVLIRPFSRKELADTLAHLTSGRIFAQVSVISSKDRGLTFSIYPDEDLLQIPRLNGLHFPDEMNQKKLFLDQISKEFRLESDAEETQLFFKIFPLPSRLIAIGGVHTAISLFGLAKELRFKTILVDPRKAFANGERFPDVDELMAEWPQDALPELKLDEGCYLVTLSHDDKLDLPAAEIACKSPAHYIGMLSSRINFSRRKISLMEMGLTKEQVNRIRTPVGLKIGAKGPQEIALAIMAEMIAVRNGIDPKSI
jgi:xanthine dehydrogenase accessory factor